MIDAGGESPSFLERQQHEADAHEVHHQQGQEVCNDRAQRVWDPSEEDAASVYILRKLTEDRREHEHNIVEGIETMPEGWGHEYCHVVHEARPLAGNQSAIIDVELQPEMDLMVPLRHHGLRWQSYLDFQDTDAVYFIEHLLAGFLILSRISKARGYDLSIS